MDSVEGMISDLQDEQERTTENMAEMHDQVVRMIKVADVLKFEAELYRMAPKTPPGPDMKDMVHEYLKERMAKRFAMFFTGLGQITAILLLGALGAMAVKVVFGL